MAPEGSYVYEHWRPDTNRPFWVGKGSGGRAGLVWRPNKHHTAVVDKLRTAGLSIKVKIVIDGLTDAEAFDIEYDRIKLWRSVGIRLANASIGGRGGMSGCVRSPESRAKQGATTKGRKFSGARLAQARAAIKKANEASVRANTGRKRSPEFSAISREVQLRSWRTNREARVSAIRQSIRPVSEETRAKMRAAKTPEARAKISAAVKTQWKNPEFRKLVSETMRRTNSKRRAA